MSPLLSELLFPLVPVCLLIGGVLGFTLRAHWTSLEKSEASLLNDIHGALLMLHARLQDVEQVLRIRRVPTAQADAKSPVPPPATPRTKQ